MHDAQSNRDFIVYCKWIYTLCYMDQTCFIVIISFWILCVFNVKWTTNIPNQIYFHWWIIGNWVPIADKLHETNIGNVEIEISTHYRDSIHSWFTCVFLIFSPAHTMQTQQHQKFFVKACGKYNLSSLKKLAKKSLLHCFQTKENKLSYYHPPHLQTLAFSSHNQKQWS